MKMRLFQHVIIAVAALMILGNLVAEAAVFPSSPSHSAQNHAAGGGQ